MARAQPDALPIDAHVHFWAVARGDYGWLDAAAVAPIRRDFAPADYPGAGRVIAVQAAPTEAETAYLLGLDDPRILGVVGWTDLTAPGDLSHPRLVGLRPMLQDIADTDWLLTAPAPGVWERVTARGLVLDALVTTRHLPMLARFADAHPDLPIVIDHGAKPQPGLGADWRAGMAALARRPNVACKLSGLMTELPDRAEVTRAIHALVALFGAERLIWGSDWPVLTLAAPYADWHALTGAALADLTPDARAAIMGGNAARIYGVAP